MRIDIYSIIQFHGNPYGSGKAAAILEFIATSGQRHTRTVMIDMPYGTRNALELKICNAAMKVLVKPCNIVFHIAGDYVASIYRNRWIDTWQQSDWIKANGKPPANVAEWKQFYTLSCMHSLSFTEVGNRFSSELEKLVTEGEIE